MDLAFSLKIRLLMRFMLKGESNKLIILSVSLSFNARIYKEQHLFIMKLAPLH